jgi:N-acetylmuramoyl-L-alanine amidase
MFISAGHSTTDPGAVAFGRTEADIVEDFRNILSKCLSDLKISHVVDGRSDENVPLKNAIKEARRHKISIEFHCNASANPSATGVEILCAPKDNALADKMCKAIAAGLSITNRGVKAANSGQHHRLGFVDAGGMIVELFFLSNRNDLAAYDQRKWQIARALAKILATA